VNQNKTLKQEFQKVPDSFEKRNVTKALLLNEKVRKTSNFDSTNIIEMWRNSRYKEGR
jgi:hypothetical protein